MRSIPSDSNARSMLLRWSSDWRFWNAALSALFFAWSAASLHGEIGLHRALPIVISQVPVLGFIWFCDFWSGWLGPLLSGGLNTKSIDRGSPAWLIAAAGWLILLSVFGLAEG